jgi:hypothetical protein
MTLVKSGMPFREAYLTSAKELQSGDTSAWQYTDQEIINGLSHLGAPGNPGLKEARKRIAVAAKIIIERREFLLEKWDALL